MMSGSISVLRASILRAAPSKGALSRLATRGKAGVAWFRRPRSAGPLLLLWTFLTTLSPGGYGKAFAEARTPLLNYPFQTDYLAQTPSVSAGAVGAFVNPASWALIGAPEAAFWWNDLNSRSGRLDNWGFSLGKHIGFSLVNYTEPRISGDGIARIYDYQLGIATGNRSGTFGVSWNWSNGDVDEIPRQSNLRVGFIQRPARWVTFGAVGHLSTQSTASQGIFDLGIRPIGGKKWCTLFADYSIANGQKIDDGDWGAGLEIRPWNGVHVGAKFREAITTKDDYRVSLNFGLTFDLFGFHAQPSYDDDGNNEYTSYLIRLAPPYKGLPVSRSIRGLKEPKRVVPVSLENRIVTYQSHKWFERRLLAWIDLARYLDAVAEEPSTKAVALNLAGTRFRPSILWELRIKLERMKEKGIEIYVHGDRMNLSTYYLASVSDQINLDPQGELFLPGVALYRTYLRGLLEKLELGFEELRYLKYKSAAEALSRRDMSDVDHEQYQRIADVLYETFRGGVTEGRNISAARFDELVDNEGMIMPAMAEAEGLIDNVARWDDYLKDMAKENPGLGVGGIPGDPNRRELPDEYWGKLPEIAVIYAVGPCSMDSGIRGRATSRYMRKLAGRSRVKGVVLRADSPGGDPLPSDLVAQETRDLKEKGKPVVVSQGDVAASGGYWISMDGSKIYTTPLTITGSIGVISGWLWDDGFGEKIGFSADGVQRGKSADLFAGIGFPFGFEGRLPHRNMNAEEKAVAKDRILELYDTFVEAVAEGREIPEDDVREIAQGRVWMGGDAMDRKLVDEFGTLQDAIDQAKADAGIPPDQRVTLVEFPPRPLFDWPDPYGDFPLGLPGILPSLLPLPWKRAAAALEPAPAFIPYGHRYLEAIADSPARPLLLLPPGALPEEYDFGE